MIHAATINNSNSNNENVQSKYLMGSRVSVKETFEKEGMLSTEQLANLCVRACILFVRFRLYIYHMYILVNIYTN